MAKPTTQTFGKFALLIGDGNSPEVFTALCGLTARSINRTAAVEETMVPDCADEDAPASVERSVSSTSYSLSGSGVAAKENLRRLLDIFNSGASNHYRLVQFDGDTPDIDTDVNAVGYEEGFFVMTSFNEKGERGKKVEFDIELQSDGEVVWHNAA